MVEKKLRMAVFALHPIQYQAPIFRQIAIKKAFELTVLYGEDIGVRDFFQLEFSKSIVWDIPLLEGYNYKFFKNLRLLKNIHLDVFYFYYKPILMLLNGIMHTLMNPM